MYTQYALCLISIFDSVRSMDPVFSAISRPILESQAFTFNLCGSLLFHSRNAIVTLILFWSLTIRAFYFALTIRYFYFCLFSATRRSQYCR